MAEAWIGRSGLVYVVCLRKVAGISNLILAELSMHLSAIMHTKLAGCFSFEVVIKKHDGSTLMTVKSMIFCDTL